MDLAHHNGGVGVQLSHDMKAYLANCGCGVWSAQMLASIGASTPVAFLSNREVISIYTKEVIIGGGNIYCIT